jgi:hypothetical protein
MAGYSGTPLPKKLGIKPGARVALLDAPKGFDATLTPLPENVSFVSGGHARFDVAVAFFTRAEDLSQRFPALVKRLEPSGGLWISWPKKTSGVATDLDENRIRAVGLATGLVDNKVCAIDETWSGLRFVVRLADRR